MKNIIYVPLWLREYLGSRGLGYEVLLSESLGDILSDSDVNSYRMVEEILYQLPEEVAAIRPVVSFFTDYLNNECPHDTSTVERWLLEIAGSETKNRNDYLFYYGLIEGPSVTGMARTGAADLVTERSKHIDFDFEVVGDTMVVLAKYNDDIDNRAYGYRAELLSKCIEKMHLFMSFEEIAGTEILSAFVKYVGMENLFIRNDAALPDRS